MPAARMTDNPLFALDLSGIMLCVGTSAEFTLYWMTYVAAPPPLCRTAARPFPCSSDHGDQRCCVHDTGHGGDERVAGGVHGGDDVLVDDRGNLVENRNVE